MTQYFALRGNLIEIQTSVRKGISTQILSTNYSFCFAFCFCKIFKCCIHNSAKKSPAFPNFRKESTIKDKGILLANVVMEPTTATVTILVFNIRGSRGEFSLINKESAGQFKPTFVLLTESQYFMNKKKK